MSCALFDPELDRHFGAGEGPFSEAARGHLEECERCRRLYGWAASAPELLDASQEAYDRIQSALKASLKPVSRGPSTRAWATRFFAGFLFFMIPAIGMMGLAGLNQMTVSQIIGMSAVMILGAALLSLSLAWQVTPGSLQRYGGRGLVLLLSGVFLLGVLFLFRWNGTEAFLARGLHCFGAGLLVAVPAMALFWVIARRGAAFEIGTLGATLGAIAGLLGAAGLQLACDHQDLLHLLVWHGGVLVTSVILGLVFILVLPRLTYR